MPGVVIPGIRSIAFNRWLANAVHGWHELLSMQLTGKVEHLRISLPNNGNGLRMIRVFDRTGLTNGGRTLLAAEHLGTYMIAVGTVQMKIVDRKFVILQGPVIDDEPTVMAVSDPTCMAAAWTYWHRVLDCAHPVAEASRTEGTLLSARQRRVMTLLAVDANDETIATAL